MGKPLHTRRIPQTYVQLLHDYLDARGVSPVAVLGALRPAPQAYGIGTVDIVVWAGMLERAAAHLGDPLLGLHLGETITPRHLGVLGYIIMACENLGAALQRFSQYQRLVFDVLPLQQRLGPGTLELVWNVSEFRPGALADETGIAVVLQFCRFITGIPLSPLLLRFPNNPPPDLQPYIDWFGCPVEFDPTQQETILRIRLETLALPLKGADPGLIAVMEQQAEQLLAALPQEAEVIEQVRKTTAKLLHDGEPDVDAVAARLFCAGRTLQRRLKDAGSSFRQELAFVRQQMAASYLGDPRLSIADIALLLGYSEHSAFSRSHKEWTGTTPQQWRQANTAIG